jgi:hypothetical protein
MAIAPHLDSNRGAGCFPPAKDKGPDENVTTAARGVRSAYAGGLRSAGV